MKIGKLLPILFILSLSVQAYPSFTETITDDMHPTQPEILSSQTFKSNPNIVGGVESHYKMVPIDELKKKGINLQCSKDGNDWGKTWTIVNPAEGKVNTNIKLLGNYGHDICNAHNYMALFTIYYELFDQFGNQMSQIDHIKVLPHSYLQNASSIFMYQLYLKKGKFVIAGSAWVQDMNLVKSTDSNYVTVTK